MKRYRAATSAASTFPPSPRFPSFQINRSPLYIDRCRSEFDRSIYSESSGLSDMDGRQEWSGRGIPARPEQGGQADAAGSSSPEREAGWHVDARAETTHPQ